MSIPTHSLTPSAAALQFRDSAGCARWIAALPVTNVQLAQQMLGEQLSALAVAQIPALERLKILESLKESIMFAQAEMAKRYIGKTAAARPGRRAGMDHRDQLCGRCWARTTACASPPLATAICRWAPYAALLTLRCLRCAAFGLFEHYQIYREPPAQAWRAFHELFGFAEKHGLSRLRVPDVFNKRDPDSSCADAYVQGLMAYLANPVRHVGTADVVPAPLAGKVVVTGQSVDATGARGTNPLSSPWISPARRYPAWPHRFRHRLRCATLSLNSSPRRCAKPSTCSNRARRPASSDWARMRASRVAKT